MRSIYKYLIAIAVGAILTAAVTCSQNEEPSVTVVTETDTIIKTVIKESPIKYVDRFIKSKPITITVPDGTTLEPTDSVTVNTTKYVGTEDLDNGTIEYEIYADSLYATKFRLTTKETIVNNTTTITKVLPPKSRLFISGGYDGVNFQPQAANVGLMYNIKQKWGIGVEARHDFSGLLPPQNRTTLGVKIYIGL